MMVYDGNEYNGDNDYSMSNCNNDDNNDNRNNSGNKRLNS